ncbi:cyclodeaminase/cyclohydrolase family protein [Paenibacillus hemerocallicola]|uniref:Cyclodeaminase/cyclohydrolase family protein n=1 Tax=Paenibacillus hemerocallicola TaxID=1172614 RepID=A0A5C4T9N3_9BACL|nr:cyclodeaminase/cyclohydrolase family protein [Paenibacillus hemerocallicola]TNJ65426.1 cyclodeaminase/cyclohydrolase family protein [Paenibacillus hemerocallicola]
MTTARGDMFDRTIRSFLDEAGAATPTPGGGSVAALAGALGAAMVSMTAGFTQGAKFAAAEPAMKDAVARLQGWTRDCEDLLEADIVSFDRYMAALKLPKATEEEKSVRGEALHAASLQAIEVPLGLMRVCRDALKLTADIASSANPNVVSDLGIGAILFEASANSAYLTVEINLAGLKDEEAAKRYDALATGLLQECAERKHAAVGAVRGIIWKGSR